MLTAASFIKDETIGVVGLGYVGLPLARLLAQHFKVIGYERDKNKLESFNDLSDMVYTGDPSALKKCKLIIVCVPTPIDNKNAPDLMPLADASYVIGKNLSPGAVVVFESTVYPGVTEEVCGKIMAENCEHRDFFLGYSPERVNPGDTKHTIDKIVKIVSGETPEVAALLADVYGHITKTHIAPNIRVAEMAKVFENTQRDANIALVNELSIICKMMGLDTLDVLDAAKTKWNFVDVRPGAPGGHCISVDPYYLIWMAKEKFGYTPDMFIQSRKTNSNMVQYFAHAISKKIETGKSICIFGVTFKANVPDLRNSKVMELAELLEENYTVHYFDPVADPAEFTHEYGKTLSTEVPLCDAIVLSAEHDAFTCLPPVAYKDFMAPGGVIFDLKGVLDRTYAAEAGVELWRP